MAGLGRMWLRIEIVLHLRDLPTLFPDIGSGHFSTVGFR
jgi:hypothetical protein